MKPRARSFCERGSVEASALRNKERIWFAACSQPFHQKLHKSCRRSNALFCIKTAWQSSVYKWRHRNFFFFDVLNAFVCHPSPEMCSFCFSGAIAMCYNWFFWNCGYCGLINCETISGHAIEVILEVSTKQEPATWYMNVDIVHFPPLTVSSKGDTTFDLICLKWHDRKRYRKLSGWCDISQFNYLHKYNINRWSSAQKRKDAVEDLISEKQNVDSVTARNVRRVEFSGN